MIPELADYFSGMESSFTNDLLFRVALRKIGIMVCNIVFYLKRLIFFF
jgi:hypothetical protein